MELQYQSPEATSKLEQLLRAGPTARKSVVNNNGVFGAPPALSISSETAQTTPSKTVPTSKETVQSSGSSPSSEGSSSSTGSDFTKSTEGTGSDSGLGGGGDEAGPGGVEVNGASDLDKHTNPKKKAVQSSSATADQDKQKASSEDLIPKKMEALQGNSNHSMQGPIGDEHKNSNGISEKPGQETKKSSTVPKGSSEYSGVIDTDQIEKLLNMPSPKSWKKSNPNNNTSPTSAGGTRRVRRFACGKCDKSYSSEADLQSHQLTHLSKEERAEQETLYGCTQCDKQFKWQASLKLHMKKFHKSPTKSEEAGGKQEVEGKKKEVDSEPEEGEIEDDEEEKKVKEKVDKKDEKKAEKKVEKVKKESKKGKDDNPPPEKATANAPVLGKRKRGTTKEKETEESKPPSKKASVTSQKKPKKEEVAPSEEDEESSEAVAAPAGGRTSLRRNIQRPKWLNDTDLVTDYGFKQSTARLGTAPASPASSTASSTAASKSSVVEKTVDKKTEAVKDKKALKPKPKSTPTKPKTAPVEPPIRPPQLKRVTEQSGSESSPTRGIQAKILSLTLETIAGKQDQKGSPLRTSARKRVSTDSTGEKATSSKKSKEEKKETPQSQRRSQRRSSKDGEKGQDSPVATNSLRYKGIKQYKKLEVVLPPMEIEGVEDEEKEKEKEDKARAVADKLNRLTKPEVSPKKTRHSERQEKQKNSPEKKEDSAKSPAQPAASPPFKKYAGADIGGFAEVKKTGEGLIEKESKAVVNGEKVEESQGEDKSLKKTLSSEEEMPVLQPETAAPSQVVTSMEESAAAVLQLSHKEGSSTSSKAASPKKKKASPSPAKSKEEKVEDKEQEKNVSVPVLPPTESLPSKDDVKDLEVSTIQDSPAPIADQDTQIISTSPEVNSEPQGTQKEEFETAPALPTDLNLPSFEDGVGEDDVIRNFQRDRSDSLSMRSCGSGSPSEKLKGLDDSSIPVAPTGSSKDNVGGSTSTGRRESQGLSRQGSASTSTRMDIVVDDEEDPMPNESEDEDDEEDDSSEDNSVPNSLLSEFSELAAQVSENMDAARFKDDCIRFMSTKISANSMWAIRKELKKLKKDKKYFKFGKLSPLAAGLMHDIFCQNLDD